MTSRIIRLALLVLACASTVALGQNRPTITVTKSLDDSVATICYDVTSPMALELSIFDRQGFIVAIPLVKNLTPGKDSVRVSFTNFPTGSYVLRTKVNNVAAPIMKLMRHAQKGQLVTYSPEETALHNSLPACDKALCPVGALTDFDAFLNKHPNYIDKGEVFSRALLAYIRLDQDTVLIAHTIDSLVAYVPTFYSYYYISRCLTEYHKLPTLASQYLLKARGLLATIPTSLQKEYASKLHEIENPQ